MGAECTVVLDVGKSLAKVSVWDGHGTLRERRQRTNAVIETGSYRALDVSGIESWLLETLRAFAKQYPIESLVPVGHGAASVVVKDGRLVCAPIDYECDVPEDIRARYVAERDAFAVTGSPLLPHGLNLGVQVAWLEKLSPETFEGDAEILLWPQYWAWVLSGVAAAEVSSLGCHTDLWCPFERRFSPLAVARGWAGRFPALRKAEAVLGRVRDRVAHETGLSAEARVICGIHDSNAALHAARGFAGPEAKAELTVLSTGTWFIAMRSGGKELASGALPQGRDCLVNVDWHGDPVPSARFMGGREIELLGDAGAAPIDDPDIQSRLVAAAPEVLRQDLMILPTFTPGMGPFPRAVGRWIGTRGDLRLEQAAICLYAALESAVMLDLLAARERLIIEGRFAQVELFVRALASLWKAGEVYVNPFADGIPLGALRLAQPEFRPPLPLKRVPPLAPDLDAYRALWSERIESMGTPA